MAEVSNVLLANQRTETGKGPARRARRAGLIPAVMYGHGIDPVHLDLPGHDAFLIVKDNPNAVVTVKYDGKSQLVLVKFVQVHPVSRAILHMDLQVVRKGEKVQVEVPVVLVGESVAGTQHQQEEFTLPVLAPATAIPESIEVSLEGLDVGAVVRVEDLTLPKDVEVEIPGDRDIVSVLALAATGDEPAVEAEESAE